MGVQQSQSPGDLGSLGTLLLFVLRLPEKQNPYLAIAKALQRPFAPVDRRQELGVGRIKRVEGSVAAITPPNRLAELGRFFGQRSEEHTSELQSRPHLVCRLLLEKTKQQSI